MNKYKIYLTAVIMSLFIACSDQDDIEPIVIDPTPLIEFSFTPEEARVKQEVSFSGRWLTGSSVITSWRWNFGDAENSISNQQNAEFSYSEEGIYTVSLTAKDAEDDSLTVSKEIVIKEPLPDPFEASITWTYNNETAVSNYNDGSSSPVIGDDGTIYYLESYAGAESKMVAVNDAGETATKKWEAALGYNLRNAPAMGPDGDLYIGAWSLEALNKVSAAAGSILWLGDTGSGISNSTAAIDDNGNVYFGTRSAGIMSWSSGGELRWAFNSDVSGARYYASPVLSADGQVLYAIITNGELYAINTSDGTLKWNEPVPYTGDGTGTSLALDDNGNIYLTSTDAVFAVEDQGENGVVKWSYTTSGANSSGVVVGEDNKIYTGSTAGLVSLNAADGTENWVYESPIEESVPAIDSKGNIYAGTTSGKLIVVNPEGELLKSLNLSENNVHSPTISSDGTVYVEAYDGAEITLFKIKVENGEGPADSPWPMKGQNRYNTGMAR